MHVPLLDLRAQYATIKAEIEAAIAEVMESQHFILGPKVEECEKALQPSGPSLAWEPRRCLLTLIQPATTWTQIKFQKK